MRKTPSGVREPSLSLSKGTHTSQLAEEIKLEDYKIRNKIR